MSALEARFQGFSSEECSAFVRELEEDAKVGNKRVLTGAEVEELLTLLSADHFRRSRRLRIKALARGWLEFEDKLSDFEAAAEALATECLRVWEAEDDVESLLKTLEELQVLQPALWYRVYRRVRERSLACAMEMEPDDKDAAFRRP